MSSEEHKTSPVSQVSFFTIFEDINVLFGCICRTIARTTRVPKRIKLSTKLLISPSRGNGKQSYLVKVWKVKIF